MTVLNDVLAFVVTRSPEPVCLDCIAQGLQLPDRLDALHKAREVAMLPGFVRHIDDCSICKSTGLITITYRAEAA